MKEKSTPDHRSVCVCPDKSGGRFAKVFPLIIARPVQAVSSGFEQDVLLIRAHWVEVHS